MIQVYPEECCRICVSFLTAALLVLSLPPEFCTGEVMPRKLVMLPCFTYGYCCILHCACLIPASASYPERVILLDAASVSHAAAPFGDLLV